MSINFENYDAVSILEKVQNELGVNMSTSCLRTEFSIPESIGVGEITTYLFKDGLALFLFNGNVKQDWEWKFKCKDDSPAFIFFSINGKIEDDKKMDDEDNFILNPMETLLVTQPGGSTRSLVFKTGEPITLAILRIDHQVFFHKKACSQNELPERMRVLFSLSKQEVKCHIPPNRFTPSAVQIVASLIDCPYTGLTRTCFMEAKAKELLSWAMHQMDIEDGEYRRKTYLANVNFDKLEEAKNILIQDLKNPPTIQELSKRVGMNRQQLKQEFKLVYNETIYQYLLERRMITAKEMMQKEKYRIGSVAAAVGYSNASHFSKRFKDQFGILPKQYMNMIWHVGQDN